MIPDKWWDKLNSQQLVNLIHSLYASNTNMVSFIMYKHQKSDLVDELYQWR